MKYRYKNRGFTLVEMIVVVGLAAILLVMVITSAFKQKIVARDKVRVADIQTIRLAVEEYKLACGEYPATLDQSTNNGHCPSGVTLDDYLPQVPVVPNYAKDDNYPGQNGNYFYYGLSSSNNGRCFDYIVGVQLEYGSDDDYENNKDGEYFDEVDRDSLRPNILHKYGHSCLGSVSNGIDGAEDFENGIYGFRSTTNSY